MTVTPSTVTTLFGLATDYLAACEEALGTTTAGAPDLTFISPGVPAFDFLCDQLVVYGATLTEEATSPLNPPASPGWRHRRGRINLAGLTAVSARCALPSGQEVVPSGPELTAASQVILEDGWAMWNTVTQKIKDGTLFGGQCSDVHFDGGLSLTSQGGLVLWQMTVRVEIGGYV